MDTSTHTVTPVHYVRYRRRHKQGGARAPIIQPHTTQRGSTSAAGLSNVFAVDDFPPLPHREERAVLKHPSSPLSFSTNPVISAHQVMEAPVQLSSPSREIGEMLVAVCTQLCNDGMAIPVCRNFPLCTEIVERRNGPEALQVCFKCDARKLHQVKRHFGTMRCAHCSSAVSCTYVRPNSCAHKFCSDCIILQLFTAVNNQDVQAWRQDCPVCGAR
jgi:hypothetical protein